MELLCLKSLYLILILSVPISIECYICLTTGTTKVTINRNKVFTEAALKKILI